MIANLMTALLLALGVATGNVSSIVYKGGNAFNNEINLKETKPQPKKVNYNYSQELTTTKKSEYEQQNPYKHYKRYELAFANSQHTTNPIVLPNLLIYNSIYTFDFPNESGNGYWAGRQVAIFSITNIYDSVTTFEMMTYVYFNTSGYRRVNYGYINYTSTDTRIDNIIGLTVNASTMNYVIDQVFNVIDKTELDNVNLYSGDTNVSSVNIENESSEITLEPQEEIYLIMYTWESDYVGTNNTTRLGMTPGHITVDSNYIAPQVNQEIVDIPGLMFTIITLPFSFYSTAFNLTIFKGTPYALNFGNLILTIIAALMLFYLIKKVIK